MGKRPNKGSKERRLAREEVSLMVTVRGQCVTIWTWNLGYHGHFTYNTQRLDMKATQ